MSRIKMEKLLKELRNIFFLLILFATFCFIPTKQASSAYHVSGDLRVYAGGGSDLIQRQKWYDGQSWITDSALSSSGLGSIAESRYYANLATGLLGTYIHGYADERGGWGSVEVSTGFKDSLLFTIPAGSYPDGLFVTLHGFVEGYLTALGCNEPDRCSNVYQVGEFSLYSDRHSLDVNTTHTYGGDPPTVISELFKLTPRFLSDGTVLENPLNISVPVSAWLQGKGAALEDNPYGDSTHEVLSDFYTTGGFTALDVPDGVTWTSESGVFLSQVPLPAAFWLLGSGLIGLLGLRKKFQK